MTNSEELKDKFNRLTDEQKAAFLKSIMPSFCELLAKDPAKMMSEVMPICREMMKSCGMNMESMMKMMGAMGGMDRGGH